MIEEDRKKKKKNFNWYFILFCKIETIIMKAKKSDIMVFLYKGLPRSIFGKKKLKKCFCFQRKRLEFKFYFLNYWIFFSLKNVECIICDLTILSLTFFLFIFIYIKHKIIKFFLWSLNLKPHYYHPLKTTQQQQLKVLFYRKKKK